MKVEFLPSGSIDCPLIRIFGTDPDEHRLFLDAVFQLANRAATSISTDELFDAPCSGNCSLFMNSGEEDRGPVKMAESGAFAWSLTPLGWSEVAELLKHFAAKRTLGSYQWIGGERAGEVSVLISYSDGGWW